MPKVENTFSKKIRQIKKSARNMTKNNQKNKLKFLPAIRIKKSEAKIEKLRVAGRYTCEDDEYDDYWWLWIFIFIFTLLAVGLIIYACIPKSHNKVVVAEGHPTEEHYHYVRRPLEYSSKPLKLDPSSIIMNANPQESSEIIASSDVVSNDIVSAVPVTETQKETLMGGNDDLESIVSDHEELSGELSGSSSISDSSQESDFLNGGTTYNVPTISDALMNMPTTPAF